MKQSAFPGKISGLFSRIALSREMCYNSVSFLREGITVPDSNPFCGSRV